MERNLTISPHPAPAELDPESGDVRDPELAGIGTRRDRTVRTVIEDARSAYLDISDSFRALGDDLWDRLHDSHSPLAAIARAPSGLGESAEDLTTTDGSAGVPSS